VEALAELKSAIELLERLVNENDTEIKQLYLKLLKAELQEAFKESRQA
jgi:hypothetical protein